MAIDRGAGIHQKVRNKSRFRVWLKKNWQTRIILKLIKNVAKVARIWDLFWKQFFRAIAKNGPPMPKTPWEIPPINKIKLDKYFGNFKLSKNITLADRTNKKPPKQIKIICEV